MEDLFKACVARIIPTIEETCRQFLQGTQQQQQTTTTAVARQEDQAIPTLLEDITAVATTAPTTTGNSTTMFDGAVPQSPQNPRTPTNLTLGVEEKVRTKIYSGEFVNFSSLLPKDLTSENNDRYKSVERDGLLVFVKAKDKDPIKTINKWMEAFHLFVAVYTEKFPTETSALMAYAQIVKKIADSCGDQAAITYDEKFRRWREQDPGACLWHVKNIELFQDAIIKGIDHRIQPNK